MDRQLQPIEYSNQRILTTQQIAEFYATNTQTIVNNFNRNRDRYIAGKHYFALEGEIKDEFIGTYFGGDLNQIDFGGHRNTLYLWTKRGAFRHAKSLNTDNAWVVYETLEENYFNPQPLPLQGYAVERLLTQDRLEFNENMRRIRRVYRAIHPLEPKSLLALKEPKPLPTIREKIIQVFHNQPRGTLLRSYDICRLGGTQLRQAGTSVIRQELEAMLAEGLLIKEGDGKSAQYGLLISA